MAYSQFHQKTAAVTTIAAENQPIVREMHPDATAAHLDPKWVAKTDVDGPAFVEKVAAQFAATTDVETRAEMLHIIADHARAVKAEETARIAALPPSGFTRAGMGVGSAQPLAAGVSFFFPRPTYYFISFHSII